MYNQDTPYNPVHHPVVQFNGDIHYRIEGDRAHLGAGFTITDPHSFGQRRCLLQLWACPARHEGGALQGIKIAECPVDTQDRAVVVALETTLALPPAGQDDYAMVLALVGVGGSGDVQLHDYANFANRQAFSQPMILGEVYCDVGADHAGLVVERILNPRQAHNRSGSLCLELWALNESYRGGAFSGTRLASTALGTLCGGFELLHNRLDIALNQIPLNGDSLVLMLREWTEAGLLTRDFRVLPSRLTEPRMAADLTAEAVSSVVPTTGLAATSIEIEVLAMQTATEQMPLVAAPVVPQPVVETVDLCADMPVCELAEAPAAAAAVTEKPAAPEAVVRAKRASDPVSVNSASAGELALIKGISPRLAAAIITDRPHGSLDALLQVRGIGRLTLERIRPFLCI
uniref:ComEA family DNA-binding protein n=1 Tax=Marinobacterium profundum TaxID=1714300 RepID=UPI000A8E01EF|nr:helix-hairpin-helix domain-containing protein [Marinobacterium profundum]